MNEIASLHSQMSGEFRMIANQGTDREIDSGWMKNLVLDSGLDRIGSGNRGMWDYCCVGTGTTAPANGQSSLVTYLASVARTSYVGNNLGASTYASQFNAVYTFAQGAVTGNIAEFGVGWASGGSGLFSRCLIIDGGGSPTTITLTSIDQLTVYYRLTITPVITDSTGTLTLNATSYPYTARQANIGTAFLNSGDPFINWIGGNLASGGHSAYPAGTAIGAITSAPSGTVFDSTGASVSLATYTNGNFYRDATITVPPTAWNATGGIGAIQMVFANTNTVANMQYAFSTAIPKTNTYTISLTFRSSWGR